MNDEMKVRMEQRNARMEQLFNKPVSELVRMIVELEEENKKSKDYRKRLLMIRNLTLEPDERRPKGRPRKVE